MKDKKLNRYMIALKHNGFVAMVLERESAAHAVRAFNESVGHKPIDDASGFVVYKVTKLGISEDTLIKKYEAGETIEGVEEVVIIARRQITVNGRLEIQRILKTHDKHWNAIISDSITLTSQDKLNYMRAVLYFAYRVEDGGGMTLLAHETLSGQVKYFDFTEHLETVYDYDE